MQDIMNSWTPNKAPILGCGYLRELIDQNASNLVSRPRTIFAICHTKIDWGSRRIGRYLGGIEIIKLDIWIFAGAQMHSLLVSSYVSTKSHYSANGS